MNKRFLLIYFLLIVSLLTVSVLGFAQDYDEEETETLMYDEETMMSWPFPEEYDLDPDDYTSALSEEGRIVYENENGITAFISGDLYGTVVDDESEAYDYAMQFISDSECDLKSLQVHEFNGLVVYTYQQLYNNSPLADCYLKLVVNDAGEVLGITSSLVEDYDDADWDDEDEQESFDLRESFSEWQSEWYETTAVTDVFPDGIDIAIPILIDPTDGSRYLADVDRQYICVNLDREDDRTDMIPLDLDSDLVFPSQLITYYFMVQVYDYFNELGWVSPDGNDSASMIVFDTSGEGNGNADYAHFNDGFHVFHFGVDDSASQSLQVIAHEFFHAVSNTNKVGPYINETGGINEALSDMVGNAVEMDVMQKDMEENVWLQNFLCSHQDEYPMYTWDEFYKPNAEDPAAADDGGDLHHKSYIVSILTWPMYHAGMTARDVAAFWYMFDLVLTPNTDYAVTAAMLPWIAEISGYSELAPMLERAVLDVRLGDPEMPEELPERQGMIRFENPLPEDSVIAVIYDPDRGSDHRTWPIRQTETIAAVMANGEYVVSVQPAEDETDIVYLWTGDHWEETDSNGLESVYEESIDDYAVWIGGTITDLN